MILSHLQKLNLEAEVLVFICVISKGEECKVYSLKYLVDLNLSLEIRTLQQIECPSDICRRTFNRRDKHGISSMFIAFIVFLSHFTQNVNSEVNRWERVNEGFCGMMLREVQRKVHLSGMHIDAFSHPWNMVVSAAWRKYPNPMNKAVTGMDVMKQEVRNGSSLRSERIIQSRFSIPAWVTKVFIIHVILQIFLWCLGDRVFAVRHMLMDC